MIQLSLIAAPGAQTSEAGKARRVDAQPRVLARLLPQTCRTPQVPWSGQILALSRAGRANKLLYMYLPKRNSGFRVSSFKRKPDCCEQALWAAPSSRGACELLPAGLPQQQGNKITGSFQKYSSLCVRVFCCERDLGAEVIFH